MKHNIMTPEVTQILTKVGHGLVFYIKNILIYYKGNVQPR